VAGVLAGGVLREGSPALIWVRAVANALVAAVVGQLILFPTEIWPRLRRPFESLRRHLAG
jgi:hypothetical protein